MNPHLTEYLKDRGLQPSGWPGNDGGDGWGFIRWIRTQRLAWGRQHGLLHLYGWTPMDRSLFTGWLMGGGRATDFEAVENAAPTSPAKPTQGVLL